MSNLADKITDKTAVIGVMGLGYVGLPLAMAFADAGYQVEGFDTNPHRIKMLTEGRTGILDIDEFKLIYQLSGVKLRLRSALPAKWKVDVVVMCVPTPITADHKPDFSCITDAVALLKDRLPKTREVLVVLESSTSPGTTRELIAIPLTERRRWFAYSPERVNPGDTEHNLKNTPKLVSGIDQKSLELAELLYSQVVERIVPVSSLEVAETAKLYENVFRNVNIALANEMAMLCDVHSGDIWETTDVAATKPFGFMPFYPGPGVGGHCVRVDPYYLLGVATEVGVDMALVKTALTVNNVAPLYVARRAVDLLGRAKIGTTEASVLVLGAAFKKNVSDTRGSPALEIVGHLRQAGITTVCRDPYTDTEEDREKGDILMAISEADLVIIATDHDCIDWERVAIHAKMILDTRGVMRRKRLDVAGGYIFTLGEKW